MAGLVAAASVVTEMFCDSASDWGRHDSGLVEQENAIMCNYLFLSVAIYTCMCICLYIHMYLCTQIYVYMYVYIHHHDR